MRTGSKQGRFRKRFFSIRAGFSHPLSKIIRFPAEKNFRFCGENIFFVRLRRFPRPQAAGFSSLKRRDGLRRTRFFLYLEGKRTLGRSVVLQGGTPVGLAFPPSASAGNRRPPHFLKAGTPLWLTSRLSERARESRIFRVSPTGVRKSDSRGGGIDVLTKRKPTRVSRFRQAGVRRVAKRLAEDGLFREATAFQPDDSFFQAGENGKDMRAARGILPPARPSVRFPAWAARPAVCPFPGKASWLPSRGLPRPFAYLLPFLISGGGCRPDCNRP